MPISKNFVKKELEKVAFFVQHSGLFDQFPIRTRKVLEELPIEWNTAETSGEVQLKWQEEPTWASADLSGTLDGNPLSLKIKKDSARNIYTLIYDKKEYQTDSLSKLKSIIESITSGTSPKPKILQAIYDLIQSKKHEIYQYVKIKYLSNITPKHWNLKIQKDVSRIYLRFYIDLIADESMEPIIAEKGEKPQIENTSPIEDVEPQIDDKDNEPAIESKDREPIKEKLREYDSYRLDSIGTYIKNLIKQSGMDISNLSFTRKYTDLANKTGFTITIK